MTERDLPAGGGDPALAAGGQDPTAQGPPPGEDWRTILDEMRRTRPRQFLLNAKIALEGADVAALAAT